MKNTLALVVVFVSFGVNLPAQTRLIQSALSGRTDFTRDIKQEDIFGSYVRVHFENCSSDCDAIADEFTQRFSMADNEDDYWSSSWQILGDDDVNLEVWFEPKKSSILPNYLKFIQENQDKPIKGRPVHISAVKAVTIPLQVNGFVATDPKDVYLGKPGHEQIIHATPVKDITAPNYGGITPLFKAANFGEIELNPEPFLSFVQKYFGDGLSNDYRTKYLKAVNLIQVKYPTTYQLDNGHTVSPGVDFPEERVFCDVGFPNCRLMK